MGYILIHVRGPGGPSLSGASARRADGVGAAPQGPRGAHLVDVRVRAEGAAAVAPGRWQSQAVDEQRRPYARRADPTCFVVPYRAKGGDVRQARSRRAAPRQDKATRGGGGSLLFHTRSRGVSASGQVTHEGAASTMRLGDFCNIIPLVEIGQPISC